ncbi:MAG: RIP metalloprotease RseP [Clostridia bacterium]|nr:RIP metalloprotease RseP [Clostridia bacterium]MDD4680652.1 RIP metalloprotease RseP [Clostridia bacterium]
MTTILIALLFFSIIIMIHELGHFLAAKAAGIYAEEFSIGMGPRLLKISGKETVYSLRLLPIGGYVRFLGEDEDSSEPRAFNNIKVWKRFLVVVSGPLMNLLLAVLLFNIAFLSFGVYEADMPVIKEVISGYPAEQAGLQAEDRIIEIGDMNVTQMEDNEAVESIRNFINDNGPKPFKITIKRDDQTLSYDIMPSLDEENKRWQIGFYFQPRIRKVSFFESIAMSFMQTYRIIGMMFVILKDLIFAGKGLGDVMGPIGIVTEIGRAAQAGIQQLLNLGIIITINLGIINLIPFPALDGGRLVLLIVEGVRGKPVDRNKEGLFNLIGFALLIILMIVVTYKDILKI